MPFRTSTSILAIPPSDYTERRGGVFCKRQWLSFRSAHVCSVRQTQRRYIVGEGRSSYSCISPMEGVLKSSETFQPQRPSPSHSRSCSQQHWMSAANPLAHSIVTSNLGFSSSVTNGIQNQVHGVIALQQGLESTLVPKAQSCSNLHDSQPYVALQ